MPTTERVRTHATARRLQRFNQFITGATEQEAIVALAIEVTWLCNEPGRILVADASGQMLGKVWNAQYYDSLTREQLASDGPRIDPDRATITRVGHYLIQSVRPLSTKVQSQYFTVEAPV